MRIYLLAGVEGDVVCRGDMVVGNVIFFSIRVTFADNDITAKRFDLIYSIYSWLRMHRIVVHTELLAPCRAVVKGAIYCAALGKQISHLAALELLSGLALYISNCAAKFSSNRIS